MEQVPERVRMAVKIALDQLRSIAVGLENARRTDAMFSGDGRYEWEVWTHDGEAKQLRIYQALQTLQEFRLRASAKGIDAESVIDELGGIPNYEPTTAIDRWMSVAQRSVV